MQSRCEDETSCREVDIKENWRLEREEEFPRAEQGLTMIIKVVKSRVPSWHCLDTTHTHTRQLLNTSGGEKRKKTTDTTVAAATDSQHAAMAAPPTRLGPVCTNKRKCGILALMQLYQQWAG